MWSFQNDGSVQCCGDHPSSVSAYGLTNVNRKVCASALQRIAGAVSTRCQQSSDRFRSSSVTLLPGTKYTPNVDLYRPARLRGGQPHMSACFWRCDRYLQFALHRYLPKTRLTQHNLLMFRSGSCFTSTPLPSSDRGFLAQSQATDIRLVTLFRRHLSVLAKATPAG